MYQYTAENNNNIAVFIVIMIENYSMETTLKFSFTSASYSTDPILTIPLQLSNRSNNMFVFMSSIT